MPWDVATWDSSFWDLPHPPPANPSRTKSKTMKHQLYFPIRIGNQVIWLRNFKLKLPEHLTALSLVPGDIVNLLLDVDHAIYGLGDYRGALAPAQSACYERIQISLYDDAVPGNITWVGFTPPAGAPAARPNGALKRVFEFINDRIKTAAGYNQAIGEDLGTEAPAIPAPPPGTTAPEFDLRAAAEGKLEVLWIKGEFDGVKLEFDRGAAGPFADIDLRPNYTLNWLPPAGQSIIIRVRLRYILKGEDFGNWSEWRQWRLNGE